MNRRRFIQSLVAVFSLPGAPGLAFRPAAAALPTVTAVPAQARSWAVYMSTLHGECTPQTLQNLLNIPAADARKYVVQLIADGALKPNPLLQKSVSEFVKTNDNSLLDRVKKRLEMKAQADVEEVEISETVEGSPDLDEDVELLDDFSDSDPVSDSELSREPDPEIIEEDALMEADIPATDEVEIQS